MKIYLVQGFTGEWDDARGWTAKAFVKKAAAKAYMNKLDAIITSFGDVTMENYSDLGDLLREVDKYASADYTGVTYDIVPLLVTE